MSNRLSIFLTLVFSNAVLSSLMCISLSTDKLTKACYNIAPTCSKNNQECIEHDSILDRDRLEFEQKERAILDFSFIPPERQQLYINSFKDAQQNLQWTDARYDFPQETKDMLVSFLVDPSPYHACLGHQFQQQLHIECLDT